MKLYDSKLAPNPRRVRIFMAEKGISCETEQIDIIKGENLSQAYPGGQSAWIGARPGS